MSALSSRNICNHTSSPIMVEEPVYELLRALGRVEIRRYGALAIAKVDESEEDIDGFNILFNYISGRNRQSKKVPMTAPVISESIEMTAPVLSDAGSIAFILPANYTAETAPIPADPRVRILTVPARVVAVLRFSGRWSEGAFHKKSKELLDEVAKAGLVKKGSVFSMLYNPPFTPWFMRRNEVGVEVEP
jgi:hypothetical protein